MEKVDSVVLNGIHFYSNGRQYEESYNQTSYNQMFEDLGIL